MVTKHQHPLPDNKMGKESFLKIKGCWHKFTLSLVSSISSGEARKEMIEMREEGTQELRLRESLGEGVAGFDLASRVRRKVYICTVFFSWCWLNQFGWVQFNQFQTFETKTKPNVFLDFLIS